MKILRVVVTASLLCLSTASGYALADENTELIAQGRYMAKMGGCNDCHTAGYLMNEGNIPEAQWLLGDRLGWRGPWGTTYASNLRLLVDDLDEEQWMTMARALQTRPPMPWWKLHEMKETDLRALYHFIRHLGPAGEAAPDYVPPDREPPPPYASFPPPPS